MHLAAEGQTNPGASAAGCSFRLRTAEWHLRKVFGKLGISSRRCSSEPRLSDQGARRRPRLGSDAGALSLYTRPG